MLAGLVLACGESSERSSSTGGSAHSGGEAGAAGGSGASAAGGTGGAKPCTSQTGNVDCAPNEYCETDGCGSGVCQKRPTTCPGDCAFVCGCDVGTHCNECLAHAAGDDAVDKSYSLCTADGGGPTKLDGGPGGLCSVYVCAAGLRCCYSCKSQGCDIRCTDPGPDGLCPVVQL